MFLTKRLMAFMFSSWLLHYTADCGEKAPSCSSGYDISNLISQLNLQFCTFVEVGQGYCSMFVEFRKDPSCPIVKPDSVAEVYLGTCDCATMRDWDLCSVPLRKSRPYECYLDDLEPNRRNGSSRVHRRLCDPTKMYEMDQPCDCSIPFAQRTLYPVKGFLTCYRAPLPKSICSTHSVCGVYNCVARNYFGLSLVQCDPLCLGKQPFCEELGPVTSRPPVITSFWSEWTCPHRNDVVEVSESICIDKETNSPAFDCLGPGSYCCPSNIKDCHCEVTTTMAEMKVTRYIFSEDIGIRKRQLFVRSFLKNRFAKRGRRNVWEHFKKGLLLFGKNKQLTASNQASKSNENLNTSTVLNNSLFSDGGILDQLPSNTGTNQQKNPIIFEPIEETTKTELIINPTNELRIATPPSPIQRRISSNDEEPLYMVINYKSVTSNAPPVFLPDEEENPWLKSNYNVDNDTKYNYLREFNFFATK